MANSASNIDLIQQNQSGKEVTANAFFNAASQAATYGRRASASSGLTWAYYGGNVRLSSGATAQIANGSLTLTASSTNYIVADKSTGAVGVSVNDTNWNDEENYWRLYSVVVGESTVTSWTDARILGEFGGGGGGGAVSSVNGQTGAVVLDAEDVGAVASLVAGSGITVDASDPQNPIVSATGGGGGREVLTADRTYYVRTDGDDNNDGLSDTSGGAFRTIQRAIDASAALDTSIYNVTISVGSGTYTEPLVLKDPVGAGSVTLTGTAVVVHTTSAIAITATASHRFILGPGIKLQTTTSGNGITSTGSTIFLDGVEFGPCAGVHLFANAGSYVQIRQNYTISGGALDHVQCANSYVQYLGGLTVTLTGTPAFTSAFARALRAGVFAAPNATFVGSATGTRYTLTTNSVIDTAGGGASYLPGSASGSATTGGQYV